MFSHPPDDTALGIARENILIAYKAYLRSIAASRAVLANRQAILAAGVYEGPFDGLNDAMSDYINKLDFGLDPTQRSRQQSNQELYEEWKRLFGKIDE